MDSKTRAIIWAQFGAAIETLENAINACPDQLWGDQSRYHQYWYMAYHTLFWLDHYLDEDREDFRPPEPFGLEEMDPAGVLPPRVYTKEELLTYLEHGRNKARRTILDMTNERAEEIIKFRKADLTFAELILYVMRHTQHHSAQLNMILRMEVGSAPGWVFRGMD